MSRIAAIDAKVIRLPLPEPLGLSNRTVVDRSWLLVRVTTDDGLAGLGFAFAGYDRPDRAVAVMRDAIAPALVGWDAGEHGVTGTDAKRRGPNTAGEPTIEAIVQRCRSAVDIALWDRNAIAAGLPLHVYLGAPVARRLPVYVGTGYYRGTVAEQAVTVRSLAQAGYRSFKIKVGRLPLSEETARAAVLLEAAGRGASMAADANGEWTLAQARHAAAALGREGYGIIEDPLPTGRFDDYRALNRSVAVEVTSGEHFRAPGQFAEAIRMGAFGSLQVDATACGGITAFLEIAGLCEAAALPFDTHWFPELSAHLAAASAAARSVEMFGGTDVVNFSDLIDSDTVLGPEGAVPGDRPGHGIKLKPAFGWDA